MLGGITLMNAMAAVETYDALTDRVYRVCDCIKKYVQRCGGKEKPEGCPLDDNSYYVARHGIIYPTHGWELYTKDIDNASVRVQAWDGYDGENYDNSEFWFPFKWLNMTDDEIVEALKGAAK